MAIEMMDRFQRAIATIDAMHAQDPEHELAHHEAMPAELAYAERMSEALEALRPDAPEALKLAIRAQHLMRWTLPREDYPEGKEGYHAWRTEQLKRHARRAGDAMAEAGYEQDEIERVKALIQKRRIKSDPDAQALEDAACLVFLENQLAEFAEGKDEGQLVEILRKTWAKMSPRGRELALAREMDPSARRLVDKALEGASG
ncbi:MAG: DUF4202 domain-containing protein [Sandaracinaceae bacterium]